MPHQSPTRSVRAWLCQARHRRSSRPLQDLGGDGDTFFFHDCMEEITHGTGGGGEEDAGFLPLLLPGTRDRDQQ